MFYSMVMLQPTQTLTLLQLSQCHSTSERGNVVRDHYDDAIDPLTMRCVISSLLGSLR